MKSGIYKITNLVNGKLYIGSAVKIQRRWIEHRAQLIAGKHHSVKLQNAWNKYGASAFEFAVLEFVEDHALLIQREQFWLDATRSATKDGYNVSPSAYSLLGFRHSEASKEKCRLAKLGKVMPAHVLDALRFANTGRKLSPEHREKLGAAQRGKKRSAESIAKTVNANRGLKRSDATRALISEAAKRRKPSFLGKRHSDQSRAKISIAKLGSIPASRKLTEAQCLEIRALRSTGATYKAIGARFGVTGECIGNLIRGTTWKT